MPRLTRSASLIFEAGLSEISFRRSLICTGVSFSFSNGRQTLHGRYPLRIDSLAEKKKVTFSLFGFRAVQEGLQKIPVVFTAVKNIPSKDSSFSRQALYMMSNVNSIFDECLYGKTSPAAGTRQPKIWQVFFCLYMGIR
jgi:hypothetical protein